MEILLEFSINFRWMDSERIHLEPKTKTNFRVFFLCFLRNQMVREHVM